MRWQAGKGPGGLPGDAAAGHQGRVAGKQASVALIIPCRSLPCLHPIDLLPAAGPLSHHLARAHDL